MKRVRTLSPFLKRVTLSPVAMTSPAPSLPGTTPSLSGNGYLPFRVQSTLQSDTKKTTYKGDNQITKVERSGVELDENVVV